MSKKIYLRSVEFAELGERDILDIFEGDIEEDRIHWKRYHLAKARYFEIKEKH